MRHRIGHGVEGAGLLGAHAHFGIVIEIETIFRRVGGKVGRLAAQRVAPRMHRKHRARIKRAAGAGKEQLDRARAGRAASGDMRGKARSTDRAADLEVGKIMAGARRIEEFYHLKGRVGRQHRRKIGRAARIGRADQRGVLTAKHTERAELGDPGGFQIEARARGDEAHRFVDHGLGDGDRTNLADRRGAGGSALESGTGQDGGGLGDAHPLLADRIPFLDPAGGRNDPRAAHMGLRQRAAAGKQQRKGGQEQGESAVHRSIYQPAEPDNSPRFILSENLRSVAQRTKLTAAACAKSYSRIGPGPALQSLRQNASPA